MSQHPENKKQAGKDVRCNMEHNNKLLVLLADDQANVRDALRLLLEQEPDIEIIGEAADASGLLFLTAQKPANVLLLDWELPGLPPHYLLRLLREERPFLRIIAMSSRPEAHQAAQEAGVSTFLSKGAPPEVVLAALSQLQPDAEPK
jgi:DNA-binding NarL/FixJ family response regulator